MSACPSLTVDELQEREQQLRAALQTAQQGAASARDALRDLQTEVLTRQGFASLVTVTALLQTVKSPALCRLSKPRCSCHQVHSELRPALAAQAQRLSAAEAEAGAARISAYEAECSASATAAAFAYAQDALRWVWSHQYFQPGHRADTGIVAAWL